MLFYGGMGLAAVSAVALLGLLGLFRMKKKRLDAQLEREYGKAKHD